MILGPWDRFVFEVFQDGFVFREAGVDVLRIGAKFASVSPFEISRDRGQRMDEGSQEGSFSLTVIPDDGGTGPMIDFQSDIRGDGFVRVTDG